MHTIITLAILAAALFLSSGGLALLSVFANPKNLDYYNSTELGATPITMSLISTGLLGVFLLYQAPQTMRTGTKKLAKIQIVVGFAMIFACYFGLEHLLA